MIENENENEIEVNGVRYLKAQEKKLVSTGVYSDYIGEYCIVRSYGAGVFFGVLESVDDNYVAVLSEARRLHYWDNHTAASCTDLALYGITEKSGSSKGSRVCAPLDKHFIMQIIEIIPCSKAATKCLKNFRIWTESDE